MGISRVPKDHQTTTFERTRPDTDWSVLTQVDDYALAIDVGGTFTDIVLLNLATGGMRLLKTPSTPDDPSRGFVTGISEILKSNGVAYSQVRRIFHGTTIATNAILEGKGTPVGVLVSEGFKYVLEIGRHSMARLAKPPRMGQAGAPGPAGARPGDTGTDSL